MPANSRKPTFFQPGCSADRHARACWSRLRRRPEPRRRRAILRLKTLPILLDHPHRLLKQFIAPCAIPAIVRDTGTVG